MQIDKRIKKLNAIITKCKRYGIKTYLFSVDPASSYLNEKLKANHRDMLGDEGETLSIIFAPLPKKVYHT